MRRLLLDTHAFLWWLSGDTSLGHQSQEFIADTTNQINISAATVWEIEIKRQLGKLTAPQDIETIVERCGFLPLPIALFHAQQAGRLPAHHRDPFDRMLIAQAQAEGLEIVTSDSAFLEYGIRIVQAAE